MDEAAGMDFRGLDADITSLAANKLTVQQLEDLLFSLDQDTRSGEELATESGQIELAKK